MAHNTRIIVNADGRATISEDILGPLGVKPGDELFVETTIPGLVNLRVAGKAGLDGFIGGLAAYATAHPLTMDEIREITKAGWAGER